MACLVDRKPGDFISQLNGNFDRVGILIEQVDEDFLDRHGLWVPGIEQEKDHPVVLLASVDGVIVCS